MGNLILHILAQIGHRMLRILVGDEDGVVAESHVAMAFCSNGAVDNAVEGDGLVLIDECYGCLEVSRAVSLVAEVLELTRPSAL